MSAGKNIERLTYRSSRHATRFAWRTVILSIVFGSAVFIILPLTAKKPVKEEKALLISKAPERIVIKLPEKEKIFEKKNVVKEREEIIEEKKPVPPEAPQPLAAPIPLRLNKLSANVELNIDLNIKPNTNFKIEKIQAVREVAEKSKAVEKPAPVNKPQRDYNAIYSEHEVDQDAQVVRRINPVYPRRALSRKITGRVIITCVISKEGRVLNPVISHSNPKGYFEESCLATIKKLRYKPAMLDGKPVAQRMEISYTFGLRE